MGKINQDGGSFNFIYNLPQIVYSSIISIIINEIVKFLVLTEKMFIEYRNTVKKGNIATLSSDIIRNIKIKFVLFFIIDLILLGLMFQFGIKNTQLHLIKDTLISFCTSFISPDNGKDIIIKEEEVTAIITTTANQKNKKNLKSGSTSIDFTKCE